MCAQVPNAGVFNGTSWYANGNSMLQAPFISHAMTLTTPKLTWGCWVRYLDNTYAERVVAAQMAPDASATIWRFCGSRRAEVNLY